MNSKIDATDFSQTSDLRAAVANLYNETYRKDKTSKYTYENVCIVPGGRSGLSRVAAVVGDVFCVRTPFHGLSSTLKMVTSSHTKFPIIQPMIKY